MSMFVMLPLAQIVGFAVGYFVIGEWFLGTVKGQGRNHRYPWERR